MISTKTVTDSKGAKFSCYTLANGRTLAYGESYEVRYYLGGEVCKVTADFSALGSCGGIYLIARDQYGNTWCPSESDVI